MDALIVEDNPHVCAVIAAYIGEMGFEVHQAHSFRAAKTALAWLTPDLILLDLVLPESSGFTLCEAIRQDPRLARVPVVVVSGRSVPMDRAAAEAAGATGFLVKPFGRPQFVEAVRRALRRDPSGPWRAAG